LEYREEAGIWVSSFSTSHLYTFINDLAVPFG
jgi:hypothetical protein